jgi:hypothetical protein
VDQRCFPQSALSFPVFTGQEVTGKGPSAFDFTLFGYFEPFGRAFVGFEFWHN